MKKTFTRKVAVVFLIIATILILFYSVVDWMGWYLILRRGESTQYYKLFGFLYSDWEDIQEKIRILHSIICNMFLVYWGSIYARAQMRLKQYIKGSFLFLGFQVLTVYLFVLIFDPQGITQGYECLIHIPYRELCWSIFFIFGLFGYYREKSK